MTENGASYSFLEDRRRAGIHPMRPILGAAVTVGFGATARARRRHARWLYSAVKRPSRDRNKTAEFDPDRADPAGVPHSQAPLYLSHRSASFRPKHEERPMIVHDLSTDAVSKMIRSNLAGATEEPPSQIEPFDFHGCTCGVASFIGRPPWEFHSSDELLHVLAGSSQLTVRQEGEELVRTLRAGDLVIIPKGCWHRNEAPEGVTMLHMTPREGGRHSWVDPES